MCWPENCWSVAEELHTTSQMLLAPDMSQHNQNDYHLGACFKNRSIAFLKPKLVQNFQIVTTRKNSIVFLWRIWILKSWALNQNDFLIGSFVIFSGWIGLRTNIFLKAQKDEATRSMSDFIKLLLNTIWVCDAKLKKCKELNDLMNLC